jgi:hypothetical protein
MLKNPSVELSVRMAMTSQHSIPFEVDVRRAAGLATLDWRQGLTVALLAPVLFAESICRVWSIAPSEVATH